MSIGGPDYNDFPFKDKINELSSSGIIIVSAIGNYGPSWGSITNPADMNDVIGVGGWMRDNEMSAFSSRGMTTWEIAHGGYGRVKPDLLAPSIAIISASHEPPYSCKALSGTSVANPIVTGIVALMLSSHSTNAIHEHGLHNVAAIKQVLHSSSTTLPNYSVFEQGSGLVNATRALGLCRDFEPHISVYPRHVSNLPSDCPYHWPWCTQKLFPTSEPLLMNLTLLNSVSVSSKV
eukprot:gene6203-7924_t